MIEDNGMIMGMWQSYYKQMSTFEEQRYYRWEYDTKEEHIRHLREVRSIGRSLYHKKPYEHHKQNAYAKLCQTIKDIEELERQNIKLN